MVIVDQALALAANVAGAVKEWLGFQSKKLDLKNQADVKAAAEAQNAANERASTAKAIAEGNIEELRKKAAE